MDGIVKEPGSRCTISRLSIVEMESVLAIKVRTGEINEEQVEIARRCLRADLSQRRLLQVDNIRYLALPGEPQGAAKERGQALGFLLGCAGSS